VQEVCISERRSDRQTQPPSVIPDGFIAVKIVLQALTGAGPEICLRFPVLGGVKTVSRERIFIGARRAIQRNDRHEIAIGTDAVLRRADRHDFLQSLAGEDQAGRHVGRVAPLLS
jgi:hypothetical protein